MTTQVKTNHVTLKSVIKSRAFRDGIQHYQKGKAPDYDAFGGDTNKAWAYERGRLFAAWARSQGAAIPRAFVNRRLSWQFLDMAHDAYHGGAFR